MFSTKNPVLNRTAPPHDLSKWSLRPAEPERTKLNPNKAAIKGETPPDQPPNVQQSINPPAWWCPCQPARYSTEREEEHYSSI